MSAASAPVQTTLQRDGLRSVVPIGLAAVQIYKGAAAAVAIGTGQGTPLVPTTVTHQFIGVWTETYNNTSGTAGAPGTAGGHTTYVARTGTWSFAQSGTTITITSIGQPVYFSDDHTVTLTGGTTFAGIIDSVDAAGNVWVDIAPAVTTASNAGKNLVALTGSADAISPHVEATYIVNSTGVDAITLAAPTATTDDGKKITIISGSAHAHTVTSTGNLNTGSSSVNTATFAAHPGASLVLEAYQGGWYVIAQIQATFS